MNLTVNFKEHILSDEFESIRENKHLKYNFEYICILGSYAHGLNHPKSDIDVRGFATPTVDDLLSFNDFDHVVSHKLDTQIYSLHKYLGMLAKSNPNIIESLGLKDEFIVYKSDIAQRILDNKDLFISKRVYQPFGGIAYSLTKSMREGAPIKYKASKFIRQKIDILRMGTEILSEGVIETYRYDKDEILDIASMVKQDGNKFYPTNECWKIIDNEKSKFEKAYKNSKLPENPDYEGIHKLEVNIGYQLIEENKGTRISITDILHRKLLGDTNA